MSEFLSGQGFLSGRVKARSPSDVTDTRYTWLSLQEAEPNLGTPQNDDSIFSSKADGTRSWLNLDGGLSVDGSGNLFVDETSVAIDTTNFDTTAASTLDQVLFDLDQAIDNNISSVTSDNSLTGDGTDSAPLGVATNGIEQDELNVSGDGDAGRVVTSNGSGAFQFGPVVTEGVYTCTTEGVQVFDSFSITDYRSAKYHVVVSSLEGGYSAAEILVLHGDDDVSIVEYEQLGPTFAVFSAQVNTSTGVIELTVDPTYENTQIVFNRTLVQNTGFGGAFPTDLQNQTLGSIDLQTQTFDPIDLNA
jgi:hypothetical protein